MSEAAHFPSFEDAICAWIRAQPGAVLEDVTDVEFLDIRTHEGGSSDAGTFWPSETIVHYRTWKLGRSGQRHSRRREVYAPSDVGDFLREIFEAAAR